VATFSIPMAQLAEKMKEDLNTVVRKATLNTFSAVAKRTPVDTGRLRGNWNASQGTINTSTTPTAAAARAMVEAERAASFEPGGVAYFANSLPYARVVEYGEYPNPPKKGKGKTVGGFSKRSPQGMVRVTAAEFNDYVQRAIAK